MGGRPTLSDTTLRATSQLMHEAMAATLDRAIEQIKAIQQDARVHGNLSRPRWPMIVLNSPKGWTGPKVVDALQVEGSLRAHQVPLADPATHPEHLKLLENWLKSYRPEELFDSNGRLQEELADLAPKGQRRMGANPHANGGILLRDLHIPDFCDYAVEVPSPATWSGCHVKGDLDLNVGLVSMPFPNCLPPSLNAAKIVQVAADRDTDRRRRIGLAPFQPSPWLRRVPRVWRRSPTPLQPPDRLCRNYCQPRLLLALPVDGFPGSIEIVSTVADLSRIRGVESDFS